MNELELGDTIKLKWITKGYMDNNKEIYYIETLSNLDYLRSALDFCFYNKLDKIAVIYVNNLKFLKLCYSAGYLCHVEFNENKSKILTFSDIGNDLKLPDSIEFSKIGRNVKFFINTSIDESLRFFGYYQNQVDQRKLLRDYKENWFECSVNTHAFEIKFKDKITGRC